MSVPRLRPAATVGTALLIPLVLVAGLVSSAERGGAGVRLAASGVQVTKVDEARFEPRPDQPVFVLLLGSDARPGLAGARADAIHLVGVNPGTGDATILNIPRDAYVPIPGRGTDKINAAFDFGGPALQARTVSQLVGVDIPWVITTGFDGLQEMVNQLGGVDVDVPFAMADADSGAFFPAGRNHFLGDDALAFSRNRHFDGGDFTRTYNQTLLILAGLAKLRSDGPSAANTIRWLSLLWRTATFDGGSLGDLYRLGRLALSVDPARVKNVTVPGSNGTAAGSSVVFLSGEANALFADFRDDAILQSR